MEALIQRFRFHRTKLIAILLLVCLLAPAPPARAQLIGIDLAPVVAAIGAINAALRNLLPGLQGISDGLSTLSSVLNTIQQFFAQVIYPPEAIGRAQQLVGTLRATYSQILAISHLNVASASLATPQQFERMLLSRDPLNVPNVTTNYQAVYGVVPTATDAPDEVRNMVDITDAAAQDALKRSIAIDAIADTEMAAADRINQELQAAAPGTAPMVEAEAAAWLVRANAYTQSAFADAMRVRSIDLSNRSGQIKFNATQAAQTRQGTIDAMR